MKKKVKQTNKQTKWNEHMVYFISLQIEVFVLQIILQCEWVYENRSNNTNINLLFFWFRDGHWSSPKMIGIFLVGKTGNLIYFMKFCNGKFVMGTLQVS